MSSELVERTETTPPLAVRMLSASLTFTKRQPLAAAGLFIIIFMCDCCRGRPCYMVRPY